jgi:VWFA-related protein
MKAAKPTLLMFALCACRLALPLSTQSLVFAGQKQAPVTQVTTRLVQVNIVVQDKKGQPVPDLTKDDFEIAEQGKPQNISVFSIESNQKAIGRAGAPSANTFSNMPSRTGATQNLTVILFDTLNTPIVDQVNAKKEVLRFLQQLEPQDRVAIYGLGNSLRIVHDFTGNAEAMARALARYRTRLSPEQVASVPAVEDNSALAANPQEAAIIAAMDAFLNETSRWVADTYIERRTAMTLQALAEISSHLASLPGRKTLVWFSAGFPFSYGTDTFYVNRANEGSRNSAEILARAERAITNANVAIYPVDARMFMSATTLNPITSAEAVMTTARQLARGVQATDMQSMDAAMSSHNTMQELANKTGGRASYNTDDVQGAIRRALDDSRVAYTLGYYPTQTKFDGKFRQIKISVKRPGVQLMYRRGYYALPDEPLDDSHRKSAINAAARSLLDATAIGFTVEVGKPAEGSSMRQFALDVDTNTVALDQEQDTWMGGLDAVFAQLDGQGGIVTSIGRTVPLKLTSAQHDQLLKDGLVLNAPIDINPKSERVRVILRNVKTGTIGTVTIPLKIDD